MTGANTLQITYGIKALPDRDPFIEFTEAGQEAFHECVINPFLVDVFPLRAFFIVFRCDVFPSLTHNTQSDIYRHGFLALVSNGRRRYGVQPPSACWKPRMRTTGVVRFVSRPNFRPVQHMR